MLVKDPLMNREDTATYLTMAKQTLCRWATYGEGPPFIKVGRAVRYRKSDLDKWLESRTVGAPSN